MKLAALIAVPDPPAGLGHRGRAGRERQADQRLAHGGDPGRRHRWAALLFISGAAVICLPRMFEVLVVENEDERHGHRVLGIFRFTFC